MIDYISFKSIAFEILDIFVGVFFFTQTTPLLEILCVSTALV